MTNTMTAATRIGLLDDHPMVREGVGNTIRAIPGTELAFSAGRAADAFAYLQANPLDILLLDISLEGQDGLALIEQFLEVQPELRIIVLTVYDEESLLVKAFARGASGYVLKESNSSQIVDAVRGAQSGLAVVAPRKLLTRVLQGWLRQEPTPNAHESFLTERELDVLRLVVEGDANKDIAGKIHLAESTVKKYCHNAMAKLGVNSRGAAAIKAMRLGLITMPPEDET